MSLSNVKIKDQNGGNGYDKKASCVYYTADRYRYAFMDPWRASDNYGISSWRKGVRFLDGLYDRGDVRNKSLERS